MLRAASEGTKLAEILPTGPSSFPSRQNEPISLQDKRGSDMYTPPFPQSNFSFSDANDPAQNRSPFTIPTVADKRKKAEKTPKASQNQQRNQPRKSKGKPKIMDFISQRERLDGTVSFCVQIRKRVGGNSLKSSRTFHTLEEARTWRDNTLAEIQLGLFEPAQKSCAKTTIRICDVISRRLSEGREL